MPIQLIAGLANPGQAYVNTRHNAGAWVIEQLIQQQQLKLRLDPKFHALGAKIQFHHQTCQCLIPNTYMNHSGHAISTWARFYQTSTPLILVVHDDLDLLPGVSRFKCGGSAGGHNGLKDVIRQLGSQDFWRLRIGIGHPRQTGLVHDYVLSQPDGADRQKIQASIQRAIEVLPYFITGDTQKAQKMLHSSTPNE